MGQAISIAVGAILIAVAILLSNHWTVIAPQTGGLGIVRLNRWTGTIDVCAIDEKSIKGGTVAGAVLECERKP
jgi:UDP-N-acetylmuramyl pentapeptide phosphotransferase/UDP-N-acetylglucosamine-1-phosphate transferase